MPGLLRLAELLVYGGFEPVRGYNTLFFQNPTLFHAVDTEERYNKGKEFQIYVKGLLSQCGYLEGQLYSTSGTYNGAYYEQLKRLGKLSYTSPDITVLNRWDHPEKDLDKRFGIACSRRDTKFTRYDKTAVTFPRFQSHALTAIQDEMGLPIFIVFGRTIGNNLYAVGVTELREPDEIINLKDQSTNNDRWIDVYLIENLMSWEKFIEHRIEWGDREPQLDIAKKLKIPSMDMFN